MALKDLKSVYGPQNPVGQKGTGQDVDVLAYETGLGFTNVNSTYGPTTAVGTTPPKYAASGRIEE